MFELRRHKSRALLRAPHDSERRRLTRVAAPRAARCAALLLSAALLTDCATPPPANAPDRTVTHALATTTDTPLAAALAPLERKHPGESAFRLLPEGTDALQMRIALGRAATRTLDLQYYIAEEDNTGKLLLASALYAADRGVRVRMLVDDLNFKDIDSVMAALNTHPNIEIRVFNPFGSAQRGMFERAQSFFTQIDHYTRRMHNKAMIADNQIAIVGGRNLGDAYFSASSTLSFRDLDALAVGPIASDISASFDTFWNSADAYPLAGLNKQHFASKDLDATRDALRADWREKASAFNAKPLNKTPLALQIAGEQLGLTWAKAELRADSPRKITAPSNTYQSPPMEHLVDSVLDAQHEVLILSPYFVPHDAGVKTLDELTRRGVRVAVLTNSMAATDAVAVQAGYSPYRVPLLQNGVELFEYKAIQDLHTDSDNPLGTKSRSSLHAKVYVIDRSTLVLGSLNFDPRSAHLNTELALFIHSPPLADQVAALIDQATSPRASYRVRLATATENAQLRSIDVSPSQLVWTSEEPGTAGPYMKTWYLDPEAGLYRNLLTGLFLLLPVDSQL